QTRRGAGSGPSAVACVFSGLPGPYRRSAEDVKLPPRATSWRGESFGTSRRLAVSCGHPPALRRAVHLLPCILVLLLYTVALAVPAGALHLGGFPGGGDSDSLFRPFALGLTAPRGAGGPAGTRAGPGRERVWSPIPAAPPIPAAVFPPPRAPPLA